MATVSANIPSDGVSTTSGDDSDDSDIVRPLIDTLLDIAVGLADEVPREGHIMGGHDAFEWGRRYTELSVSSCFVCETNVSLNWDPENAGWLTGQVTPVKFIATEEGCSRNLRPVCLGLCRVLLG